MIRRLRCRWPFEPWDCTACGRRIEGAAPVSATAGLVCEPCIDRGRRGEPFIPLTVNMVESKSPREKRPLVAVCVRDNQCVTEAGSVFDLTGLVERIRDREHGEAGRKGRLRSNLPAQLPPSIVVTDMGMELLAFLDHSPCARSPLWQWQATLRTPSAWRPEARASSPRAWTIPKPVMFGYASRRGGRRHAEGRARWYQLLDVTDFCELPNGWGEPDAAELMRFAICLREWACSNQLPMLTSASAYGSRLLRDARFGGGWRRKVPSSTNSQLRRHLPGNHYQLLTRPNLRHAQVHKLDQEGAHHYAALNTRFPHPDLLRADGWFRQLPPADGAPVRDHGPIRHLSDRWSQLIERPGLFCIAVHADERMAADRLELPALRRAGVRWRMLTSVEIAHLAATGRKFILGDIWAAWTSVEVDERLNEYAWWSGRELDHNRVLRGWLKPTLLAGYGLLAAKPRRYRTAWRWCSRPDGGVGFQTSRGLLVGYERATKREREPQTTNVLWRALIESQVRLESLTFARRLREQGWRPIAIYADAVFATGPDGPPTPSPWRYEGVVHDLEFESPARYRSREETRLPGSPRARDGLQRVLITDNSTGGGESNSKHEEASQQPPEQRRPSGTKQPPAEATAAAAAA